MLLSFQIYHRQIFKLLLSNKVLDEPRQRRLFKTTDLVELFNLNEPINGEFSESDRLFRESKLTPVLGGFSSSKIEQMKKLASSLSKKISASVKLMRDVNENTNSSTCEEKCDGQNDNLKRVEVLVTENNLLVDQTSSPSQINTQKSPSKCNEDFNTNSDIDIQRNSNIENENTCKKDNCDVIPMKSLNNSVEKESKFILNDGKVTTRKRKKHKKDSHSDKRNVSAMFEGERVSCLIGRRLGHSDEKEESVSTADDDYVLRKLFAKSSKLIFYIEKNILYLI